MMSKNEREAVKQSIKHWKENVAAIKKAIKNKKKIINNDLHLEWRSSGKQIASYHSDSCELCRHYSGNDCFFCPLKKAGFRCSNDNSPWSHVRNADARKDILATAERMLAVLKRIGGKALLSTQRLQLK